MKKPEKMNNKHTHHNQEEKHETSATRKGFMLFMFFALMSACVWAQSPAKPDSAVSTRTTTSTYQIGIGPSRILDTYLSAAHFKGTGFTFLATKEYNKEHNRWSTLMEHQAHLSTSSDRADKAKELEGSYNFFIGRFYEWNFLADRLKVQAGAMLDANIGFIYNTVNGNNPAQARVNVNIMPSATAAYKFRMFHRQAAVRYEAQLPFVGIMFSPNYGQSYYEIFSQGNYDHNIVPTTFVSAPDFRQQLSLDLNLSKRFTFRIGYLGDYQQASVNNLKSHIYSHRIMIGFVKRFKLISYRP